MHGHSVRKIVPVAAQSNNPPPPPVCEPAVLTALATVRASRLQAERTDLLRCCPVTRAARTTAGTWHRTGDDQLEPTPTVGTPETNTVSSSRSTLKCHLSPCRPDLSTAEGRWPRRA